MPRVVVVGGGTAGMEAAREALMRGADVTVIEQSERLDPPWRDWPDLICASPRAGSSGPAVRPGEAWRIELGVKVLFVGTGSVRTASGASLGADSVVVATGSSAAPPDLRGVRKSGSFYLDSASRYESLGRSVSASERPVVAGEGGRGLEVAERLSSGGRKVALIVSGWSNGGPGPAALAAVAAGAAERGVSLNPGRVGRVVGGDGVEAVLAEGEVLPCDAFAFVPDRLPRVPSSSASRGPSGGIRVDSLLRTSVPGVLAAGGCAEPSGSTSPETTLKEVPAASGRVAGANAAGGDVCTRPSCAFYLSVFGLHWLRLRLSSPGKQPVGGLATVTLRRDPLSVCTIAHDGRGRVVSIEAVERRAPGRGVLSLPGHSGSTLKSLAYEPLDSTDISLVSDTARLGLARWSGF